MPNSVISPARLLCLTLMLMLGGCMFGPDYRRPEIDAPKAFRFDNKQVQDIADTMWWEQFQDPVMNDLIKAALAENKNVGIAAARIMEFQGHYGATRSELFPQIGGQVGARHNKLNSLTLPPPLASNTTRSWELYTVSINASWELDIWGRIRRLSEAARAQLLASEEGRRATILTLVSSVASSYINLLALDRQLEIAKRTAASRAQSVEVFELRFAGGVISQMELAQIQSQYEVAAAAIPPLESQIAQQENALSVLLGRPPGPIPRGRELKELNLPVVSAGLPSELLVRRPDLQQAEQKLIAANAEIGAARALYLPRISLTGLLGVASNHLSGMFSSPARLAAFGVVTSIPIFTAGGIAGQVKQAEGRHQQALLQYEQAILVAFKEVEDALISVQKTREQLTPQSRRVDALRDYNEMARLRYDEGYTSYIEVLDSERSLFEAETSFAQIQGTVFGSLINLYMVLGGGWVAEADQVSKQAVPVNN
ncbi:efflux transporter outer membrane subunit [Nitrosospira sp. Nsp13]|uniref:efflux transporter outer membrane subunit n=1 Tax=Nitrosospira sp. Nsp13 TaxID=1855332 RepID=UPI00088E5287|nr:efflux transporter outer membrane subunit [Nitrosospira sp. Nsp13]SCY10821.1 outer membrane protein, multidrug efflux system [Nitrosospira sp. Nsp13]